jgi:hypothetical protein
MTAKNRRRDQAKVDEQSYKFYATLHRCNFYPRSLLTADHRGGLGHSWDGPASEGKLLKYLWMPVHVFYSR